MPAEFKRVMDAILLEFPCARACIEDIPVMSKGCKIEHISLVKKTSGKLDFKKWHLNWKSVNSHDLNTNGLAIGSQVLVLHHWFEKRTLLIN